MATVRFQFSSFAQSCRTLRPHKLQQSCFPVHHQLPEPLMSIASVMPSNHLILCRPILLLPSIFSSIRVFSNESVLQIRWPEYWSFSFSISPSIEYSGLISFRIDWLDLLAVQRTVKSLLQYHSSEASILQHSALFLVQLSHPYMTTGKAKHDHWGEKKKHFFPYFCQNVQLFHLPLQIVHCRPTSSF